MKLKNLISFLIIFQTFTLIFGQEGGPPMLTDDARVADYKEWEFNTSFNTSITNQIQIALPSGDFNYGLLPWMQPKIEVPLLFTFEKGKKTKTEIGDIGAGLKMTFLNEKKHFISAATFPTYFINPHTADQAVLMPLFIEKTLGKFLIGQGFGYIFGFDKNNTIEYGTLVGFKPVENVDLMLEYFIYKYYADYKPINGTPGYVNMGFRWMIGDDFMIMGSFGTQVVTPTGSEREKFISWLGIKNTF